MVSAETIKFIKCNGRKVFFRYELLDKKEAFKKILTTVSDCTITYNSLSQLKSSAQIIMEEDQSCDYLNDRIRIICCIEKDKKTMEFPLGIFLITSPEREIAGAKIERSIELYSKLQIYNDDKLTERLTVPAGAKIINEIVRLLNTSQYRITATNKTCSVNREWEMGTAKLEVINDLLESINYTSLRVASDGYFVAEPYKLPQDRGIEISYLDDSESVLGTKISDALDLFDVPNVFVRYTNNPDAKSLRAEYANNNADSMTSTVSRGRKIVDCQEVKDAVDLETLQAVAKRKAAEAAQVYSHIEFYTAIMPIHEYLTILYVRHKNLIEGKYEEVEWEIHAKAGEFMRHKARKVVNV